MKKTILIIVGVIIIIAVVGVWLYVFTYGAPKNSEEIFGRFGFGGNTEVTPAPVVTPTVVEVPDEVDPNVSKNLQQLTTRPVAGATFIDSKIMYVEQGTGHIYTIDLKDGKETLVNGTTLAKSADAVFSPNGASVAITSYTSSGNFVAVQKTVLGSTSTEGITLPSGAREVAFSKDSRSVTYLLTDELGASGYSYNLLTGKSTTLFTIPLRDVRIVWGTPTYVYTTPSATAVGFIYKIEGNNLTYVTRGGFGLTSTPYEGGVVITKILDGSIQTSALATKGGQAELPLSLIPEKCVAQKTTLFCAVPSEDLDVRTFPDSWYKGVTSYSDILWSVNTETNVSTVLSNFRSESGREVDVSKIGIDAEGKRLYFVNKNDNTLWMFDMTIE